MENPESQEEKCVLDSYHLARANHNVEKISNDHVFITTPKKPSHWAVAGGALLRPIHGTGLMAICVSGSVGQVRELLNP